MARCKSCGARITWLETAGGKKIPVDEDPDPGGNIVVISGTIARVYRDAKTAQEGWPGKPRYLSHFATCPQAASWRRPQQ